MNGSQDSGSTLQESGAATESNFPANNTTDGVAPCPLAKARQTWIEIELYDHEGTPCANEPYSITLPDGTALKDQQLDGNGFARHDDVPPGDCLVEFPEREAFDPQDNPKDTFEVVLLDPDGKPAAGEPYLIILSDGTQLEGTLDEQGMVQQSEVPPGFFRIYFPERPHFRWEVV